MHCMPQSTTLTTFRAPTPAISIYLVLDQQFLKICKKSSKFLLLMFGFLTLILMEDGGEWGNFTPPTSWFSLNKGNSCNP